MACCDRIDLVANQLWSHFTDPGMGRFHRQLAPTNLRPLPSALAPIAAGSAAATVAIDPSSASSPSLDCIARDRANRGHQAKCDGKVVVTSFLGEIGGSEIDGDALRRKPETDRVKRSANTLAALGDCLVGKADDGEGRDARADLDLHVDGARLDPLESDPS